VGIATTSDTPDSNLLIELKNKSENVDLRWPQVETNIHIFFKSGKQVGKGKIGKGKNLEISTCGCCRSDSIWRKMHDSMHAAQKPKSNLKFVTLDNKNNMSY